DHDVYVNVTGGVRVEEPAVDLGVALAVASAFRDRPVQGGTACFGEVGLTGDVRFVSGAQRRAGELLKMGFARIIGPTGARVGESAEGGRAKGNISENGEKDRGRKIDVVETRTLGEAVEAALL
ncbi:MAG: hypothetical protein L0G70_10740, partial [Rubrobacter sp.]|nr:hypothetical protein [Rubrobacter sp.]